MSDYPRYDIVSINFAWKEDRLPAEYDCVDPDGRVRNGCGQTHMFLDSVDRYEVYEAALLWFWQIYAPRRRRDDTDKPRLQDIRDLVVTVSEPRSDTWCQGWFSHWTYDTGLSDPEVLRSFGEYVSRHERYQDWRPQDPGYKKIAAEHPCLMGAEDRYRWTARAEGTSRIGCGDSTGEAPCRCDGCRKRGIVTIDH